ncbi:hypothetical protein GCM10009411_16250 [Shewanella litoralis]|uniref:50S ribosomal protein L36 n=1 Tax=Shewanella litoralis TaxID=2282700 RepID=A0ABQ2R8K7_9GAMM|nr:hypothetical protein GCM10009411_16250 [Shewanella litoralis]
MTRTTKPQANKVRVVVSPKVVKKRCCVIKMRKSDEKITINKRTSKNCH